MNGKICRLFYKPRTIFETVLNIRSYKYTNLRTSITSLITNRNFSLNASNFFFYDFYIFVFFLIVNFKFFKSWLNFPKLETIELTGILKLLILKFLNYLIYYFVMNFNLREKRYKFLSTF